ncbi:MAG: TIGR04282 family arsenosugar biosynthesis glycosyltransferase [Desulfobacterales bacterium]|nr:TIGR04282 family arsenosugar biosynthesis glycosyltransferase [Desulfobacterales bacterium]
MEGNLIQVFMRAPELGRVKTRLAKDLGPEQALAFYRSCVVHTLAMAEGAGIPWEVCFCPSHQGGMIREWLGRDISITSQGPGDLGERMAHAMASAFDRGASRVILVGTDIPGIRSRHFDAALAWLGKRDVVLGPSRDGGYWLIGFNRASFDPGVFLGMEWSHPQVARDTRIRIRQAGLSLGELSPLQDVDTMSDLRRFEAEGGCLPGFSLNDPGK